jgi:protoheme IX farnesyltransferase
MNLAPGSPDLHVTMILLVGTALIVGAANTLNMYLERDLDCLMSRTRNRPLPQRRLAPQTALLFGAILGALSLPTLASVNLLTGALGVLALISYVLLYTPLKQRTHWATWIGAVPGAMPVLMGWAAATGTVDIAGLAVFAVLFFWQIPHFHAIAIFRQHEYDRAGLKTLPSSGGEDRTRYQIKLFLLVQVAASLMVTALGIAGTLYTVIAAVLGVGVLLQGFFGETRGIRPWARGVFVASLAYLPILFLVMILDGKV